jgi:pimeloyl-ACP methyl ester carboxylesterase
MRDHARSWDWVAERFAPFYHVIAPDLRGHGDSDWASDGAYALFDYVSDLANVVDALALKEFDLVGHSLGGHICLRYAATFPEKLRSLTIIEGIELPIIRDQRREALPYPRRLRKWIEDQREWERRTTRYYDTQEDAQARMAGQHPAIDADTIAHLTRHGLIREAGKGLRWKYDNACRFRAPDDAHGIDLDDILDAIACPTLLAYGDASWIPLPPPERLARIRDHQVVTFPGASHWLHHQSRKPFLAAVATFLSRTESDDCRKREAHA